MLIKLLKYEIKSTAKMFFLMSAVMLGFCLLAGLGRLIDNNVIYNLIIVPAVLASIAYIIVYFVICLLHFYNQITGRESYLIHTLPVKTSTLILSKYLSTLFWGMFTLVTLCLFWFGPGEFFIFRPMSFSLYIIFDTNYTGGINTLFLLTCTLAQVVLFLIPMTGFFICLINLPALKNRNRSLPIAIIGWIATGQVIGIIQIAILFLLMWLRGDIQAFFNEEMQAVIKFAENLCYTMLVTYTISGAAFYAGMVKITSKHRSI